MGTLSRDTPLLIKSSMPDTIDAEAATGATTGMCAARPPLVGWGDEVDVTDIIEDGAPSAGGGPSGEGGGGCG